MAQASRDGNNVPTLLGASSSDGITPVRIKVNPVNHALVIDDASSGTDHGVANAVRDQNFVPVLLAVSSTTATVGGINYIQGVTPVEVYGVAATGALLVDSN